MMPEGNKNLSESAPREINDIERLMNEEGDRESAAAVTSGNIGMGSFMQRKSPFWKSKRGFFILI